MILCVYRRNEHELRVLPPAAAEILTASSEITNLAVAEERDALHALFADMPPRTVPRDGAPLVNPELFFDPHRARFYEGLAGRRRDVFWLVYDFLPFLQPQWFDQGASRTAMHYLRALRSVPRVAFISEHTRQDYRQRVMRSTERDGPVIVLGGDGLGLETQRFDPTRDGYVVLGSLEPRKRAAAVIEAFVALWAEGCRSRLTVIGRLLPHAAAEIALLEKVQHQPLFRHLPEASDAAVRGELRRARAMIFASEGEGFGLPPFESLHCGIPVIVAADLPSTGMLPSHGQLRLDRITPAAIAEAVRLVEDDGAARALWDAAASLHVPSWRDFAQTLAGWVHPA